jgi:hypothetical protein
LALRRKLRGFLRYSPTAKRAAVDAARGTTCGTSSSSRAELTAHARLLADFEAEWPDLNEAVADFENIEILQSN